MDFKEVVEKRRTTRQFKNTPVGREVIERIIKAGLSAPSFDYCRKTNEGLSCAMRIPTEGQSETILATVGCAKDFILPCMIGIGHPADDAEYPTQTYPALEDCIHWNKW